ncbi:TRAP transporter small permease [Puniceibacterium sp. IMCC21224]|uniref:TRAP transporter small permease n=1 Tax=Puniceibacterium sp. IMCC21224 TaxID=1618204 RepID=UPI00064DEFAA|nr:TRAP transporter small permease [Puniceibacterium sp. IMCC21224]KMK68272.1 TRAP-type C4-dicarboxylate transport system, small permease component [Puniceibacterium sp. IMCC21224]
MKQILIGLETGATGLLALAAALLTVSESILRYLAPTLLPDWGAEVTVYLVGWAVMLGASRLIRDQMHVSVDMLVEALPPRTRWVLRVFTCLFGVVIAGFIAYAGWLMVDFALMLGERSDSSIRFPMWGYYAAIPVGFALCSATYLWQLVLLITGQEG